MYSQEQICQDNGTLSLQFNSCQGHICCWLTKVLMSMQRYQLTFQLFVFRFLSMFTCNNMLRKVKALESSTSNCGRDEHEDLTHVTVGLSHRWQIYSLHASVAIKIRLCAGGCTFLIFELNTTHYST